MGVTVFSSWEGYQYLWTRKQIVVDSIILPLDLWHSYGISLVNGMLSNMKLAEDENVLAQLSFPSCTLPLPWEEDSVGKLLPLSLAYVKKTHERDLSPTSSEGLETLPKSSQSVCFIFMSSHIILPLISHSLSGEGSSTIGSWIQSPLVLPLIKKKPATWLNFLIIS